MFWRHVLVAVFFLGTFSLQVRADDAKPATKKTAITWKKTVLDKAFRSEGVAIGDVNKDGKMDVIAGDVWYEAPDWKMHVIRQDRTYNPGLGYSQSFGCFADDFNGDGWIDVIVIPFPGAPCSWYENPGKKEGPWKEHVLSHSACNETPVYAELFGDGKRVLVMGVQPKGQENMGQMFWLRPGKDPTQLWEHHPISVPSQKGQVVPGTFRFSHGLGVGDVNGDGKNDVICTGGWWEQPATLSAQPWKFHRADLEPACADMYAYDFDGDGKNDILSTSAHGFGMWWHQQKGRDGSTFVRQELFLGAAVVADKKNYLLSSNEKKLLDLINIHRATKNLRPVRAVPGLCRQARKKTKDKTPPSVPVKWISLEAGGSGFKSPEELIKYWISGDNNKILLDANWLEAGIGFAEPGKDRENTSAVLILAEGNTPPNKGIVVWEGMKKQFVSQTHALHFVDINGDGVKDMVTGRRWWAHQSRGDAAPTEPAYLFWFEGKKGKDGITTFIPHLIDDDSGIGTQFTVADINGDGIPDIIISNKKGVFVFEQVREPILDALPK